MSEITMSNRFAINFSTASAPPDAVSTVKPHLVRVSPKAYLISESSSTRSINGFILLLLCLISSLPGQAVCRYLYDKERPLSQLTVRPDTSPMDPDDVVHDRQSQPCPLLLCGIERIKYPVSILRAYPAPAVFNIDLCLRPRLALQCMDGQTASRGDRLERI